MKKTSKNISKRTSSSHNKSTSASKSFSKNTSKSYNTSGGKNTSKNAGKTAGKNTNHSLNASAKSKSKKSKIYRKNQDDDDDDFTTVPLDNRYEKNTAAVTVNQDDDEFDLDGSMDWESSSDLDLPARGPSGSSESIYNADLDVNDYMDENNSDVNDNIDLNDDSDMQEKKDLDLVDDDDFDNDDPDLDQEMDDDFESEQKESKKLVKSANRKGKKSGGFQSMGLSHPLFKAILHMGYKIPTPIQRKSIPLLLEGGDVVAMARTGSGKTAAFLIPLVEKLKVHSVKVGVRALILSPSRELASQTAKFTKDLTKYTDLRTSVFVGGENMDNQFGEIASNPDIVIATPGRLMHLIIEAGLEMKAVEYLVFDEADRLFEMGFAEQLREILLLVPASRQTVLFSATLPKILVDFARAGLVNPSLIRLDVDTKISKDLQMYFFALKKEEKDGALLHLLTTLIPKHEQTVVFAATKHHVEYLTLLLQTNGIPATLIYGTLDPMARKINLARFKHGKVRVLVVTDVAARGIDVPLLDNVINFSFPPSCKIFVHRVGRTARAGKQGKAWSLVSISDELAYMLDLQLFTGRPLIYAHVAQQSRLAVNYTAQIVLGTLPGNAVALHCESVHTLVKNDVQLTAMSNSMTLGYKMYIRSRPAATKSSHTRAKEIVGHTYGLHPLFADLQNEKEVNRESILSSLAQYRPSESIFEVASSSTRKKGIKTSNEALLMQKRRSQFGEKIAQRVRKEGEAVVGEVERQKSMLERESGSLGQEEVEFDGFNDLSGGKKSAAKKGRREISETNDFKLSYRPADDMTEAGYAVHDASFNSHAHKAAMELVPDDDEQMRKKKGIQTWDSKKHRFTSHQIGSDNKKRVRTENGTLVPATFQSDRFSKWKNKTKVDLPRVGDQELANAADMTMKQSRFRHNSTTAPTLSSKSFQRKMDSQETQWRKQGLKGADLANAKSEWLAGKGVTKTVGRKGKSELKTAQQIAKERLELDKRRAKTGRHNVGKKKGSKGPRQKS